jgi:hypothetical protein
MEGGKVTIKKLGGEDPVTPTQTREQKTTPNPPASSYGGKKTLKTFPRGILKTAKVMRIKGVTDPAKAPPLKSSVKKHTIRILTDKGLKKHRKTIKKKISKLSDSKAKELAMKAGLVKSASMPAPMVKDVLAGAVTAGFVSLD